MKRLLFFLVLLFLTGCAPTGEASYDFAPAEENRLVVYTSHKEAVYGPIIKEFEERTGIWVEVVAGGTNELLERIAEEKGPVCDVIFGGGVESLTAYEAYFEPYIYSEIDAIKPELCSEDNLWTPFSSLPIVLIYNTRLVPKGAITGWADLLAEEWQGKIAFADPTMSGSSYTAIATMMQCLGGNHWNTMAWFAQNLDGKLLADSGDVVQRVAGGSLLVGVTLEETALKWQAQGANIGIVYPHEGTSAVPDGCALIAGGPHPENARLFLEFVVGEDVQQLVVEQLRRRSVRNDQEEPGDLLRENEMNLIRYDIHWAGEIKAEFALRWAELYRGNPR